MLKHISKYLTTTLLCVAVAFVASASPSKLKFPRSANANIGIMVRDLRSGRDIVSENPAKFLTPASILKCVTAASVILDGKENYTFPTTCGMNGIISRDGTLYGDITVAGSGDPTLECHNLPGSERVIDSIANAIAARGVTKIAGCLQVDSLSYPLREPGALPKWEVEDMLWSYGAGLFILNYNNNTEGVDRALVEPVETFIDALEERLLRDSIKVEWNENTFFADDSSSLFFTHVSPPAKEILREMMFMSNNLYAEGILRTLAPGQFRRDALNRENDVLEANGMNTQEFVAFDGSGLTRNSKLTPQFMTELLAMMATGDKADLYASLFPKAGMEGTVKKLLKGTRLEGKLALKSGSMNGVQCFAGYKLDDNGRPSHTVVIMVNDFTCKRVVLMKAISNFLLQQF